MENAYRRNNRRCIIYRSSNPKPVAGITKAQQAAYPWKAITVMISNRNVADIA